MDNEREGTEVVKHEDVAAVMETGGRFDLADVGDPTAGLETARKLVSYMAKKCTGPEYIAQIQGRRYPKVDWWTTVGGGLGLFPREESCRKLDRPNETVYEATVGVYNGDQLVTRASAICSDKESTWSGRDEYAIKSMAITRATGKAYRVGLSFLPVMAGLEPTPAEEMPQDGGSGRPASDKQVEYVRDLLKEREAPEDGRQKTVRALERGMTADEASKAIEWLKSKPKKEEGEDEPDEDTDPVTSARRQWIELYEQHRDPDRRREWETEALREHYDEVPTYKDSGLVDHSQLTEEHYETLADHLIAQVDEASQEALPV